MNMTFAEKSLWVVLFATLLVYGPYFSSVISELFLDGRNVEVGEVVSIAGLVAYLIGLLIVGHITIAVADRRGDPDERDRAIRLLGTRNAAFVLGGGVVSAICVAIAIEGNYLVVHVLLATLVIAELVEVGSALILYRRGI